MANKIMVQAAGWTGTGKSVFVALLCRLFSKDGYKVAPFKTLNFTPVTYEKDGKEFGYAQALQSVVAGQNPDYRTNPFTPKPYEGKLDLILEGEYIEKNLHWEKILTKGLIGRLKETYGRVREVARRNLEELSKEYDIVCIEGAGPGKVPIRKLEFLDVANMETARIANSPVLLLTNDLDSVQGILSYMKKEEKRMVKGIIWNKVRINDILRLGVKKEYMKFEMKWIKLFYQKLIKKEIVGIVPYFAKLAKLPEPDPIVPSPKIPFERWKKVIASIAKEAKEYVNLERIYELMK